MKVLQTAGDVKRLVDVGTRPSRIRRTQMGGVEPFPAQEGTDLPGLCAGVRLLHNPHFVLRGETPAFRLRRRRSGRHPARGRCAVGGASATLRLPQRRPQLPYLSSPPYSVNFGMQVSHPI